MDYKQSCIPPVSTDQATVKANQGRPSMSSTLSPCSSPAPPFSSGLYLTIPRRKPMPTKLDDVQISGWIDAMKSSSPPRRALSKDAKYEAETEEEDSLVYRTWLKKYPSALSSFEKITDYAKGKKIALFLDYDGTLSPIVDNPDHAFMSNAMRSAVKNVAKFFPATIISGRSRDKVYEFVGLEELLYAGSHGMDMVGPLTNSHSFLSISQNCISSNDKQFKDLSFFQPAREFLPMIDEVFRSLVENTRDIKGSKVENNKFCLSVHYRLVDEKNWGLIAQRVHDILRNYPRMHITYGRKVLEIRPVINWDKGKAIELLLESLGMNDGDDVLPIYVGDDRTDEDAFKVLREGKRGYGIVVSSVPKETDAHFSLKDTSEVMVFLRALVRWKKSQIATAHRSA